MRFFKRKPAKDETEISVAANAANVVSIYVKAQTTEKAFDLFCKLKEESKKK